MSKSTTKPERIEKFRNLFSAIYPAEVHERLCDELDAMGFFDAPASTKYHGNYSGGLFDHCYEITNALLKLTDQLHLQWQRPESPYLVGMLHDLCKCDQYQYITATREWVYKKDLSLNGHGDKSVILAQTLVELTGEEILCIRWHMGAYDEKENWNSLGAAIEQYPNVLYTHTADMIASRIIGI